MKKEQQDHLLNYLKSRVEGTVQNGQVIPVVTQLTSTNATTYINAGTTIYNLDQTNFDNTDDIIFVAQSGALAGGQLDVQLYDVTNATEIELLTFSSGGGEAYTIKTSSIKAYLVSVESGRITLEINVKRSGAGGAVDMTCSTIEVFGV